MLSWKRTGAIGRKRKKRMRKRLAMWRRRSISVSTNIWWSSHAQTFSSGLFFLLHFQKCETISRSFYLLSNVCMSFARKFFAGSDRNQRGQWEWILVMPSLVERNFRCILIPRRRIPTLPPPPNSHLFLENSCVLLFSSKSFLPTFEVMACYCFDEEMGGNWKKWRGGGREGGEMGDERLLSFELCSIFIWDVLKSYEGTNFEVA